MKVKPQIPFFYYKLFKWFCRKELWDELQGDLEESFQFNKEVKGLRYAQNEYRKEVIRLFRPTVVKKTNPLVMNNSSGLISNYTKIAIRNLLKDKTHALISILGLSLGITTAVLLIQFNKFEESYDKFHAKSDQVFRIRNDVKSQASGEITGTRATTFFAAHPTVSIEIPEVVNSTHIREVEGVIGYGENSFKEEDVLVTTASFFEIFSFEILIGNPKDLDKTRTVFISESLAKKLFATKDPIGKQIEYDDIRIGGHFELTVAGVFEDISENSHIKAEMLMSIAELKSYIRENQTFGPVLTLENAKWRWNEFYTYIETQKGANKQIVSEKINALYAKYRREWDDRLGRSQIVSLQPLTTIHLESDLFAELDTPGSKDLVLFFYLVTLLILLIAWINYVNMATAKAMNRGREVGIRKVLGAFRKQLVFQFLFESLLINTLAIVFSIGLLVLIVPSFELFIGKNVFDQFFELKMFWSLFGFSIFIGALLSGIYPALVLSSFQPSKVLKVSFKYTGHGVWLRKGLVVLQFIFAIFLLSGATAIQSQLNFMINHDPGVSIDHSLIINTPVFATRDSTYFNKINSLKSSFDQIRGINEYAISSLIPGITNRWRGSCGLVNDSDQESPLFSRLSASHEYVDLYNMNLIAGRNFNDEMKGDRQVALLNRKGAQSLGFSNPEEILEKRVLFPGNQQFRVIGVVENFYQNGMLTDFEPMAIQLDTLDAGNYLSVKVKKDGIRETLSAIEKEFGRIFPNSPFDYFFLDKKFNDQYNSDQKFQQIFNYFTFIAIFIACLGLLGLSSFFMSQKKKEVTVRKVLGASVTEIIKLLLKEYAWLILIAGGVSIPLAYFVIDSWLNNYVFRININILMFLFPVILLSLIVTLTISNQTWKTATTNPTDHLKSE